MKLLALKIPGPNGTQTTIDAPTGVPQGIRLGPLIVLVIEVMMVVGIILSLIYLVYGGLFWITSKGDKEQLDKARRIIVYSIIGLIVMSIALVLVSVFTAAIGVDTLIQR
jgi:hypothetical protein